MHATNRKLRGKIDIDLIDLHECHTIDVIFLIYYG
jgi:hypothetical protein